MTDHRAVPDYSYNFSAIHPWMPGTFVVRTITDTMHLVVNDSAAESLVRQVRPQANGDFVGDSDWLPAEYQEIHVGDEASFRLIRSEGYGEDLAYTDTWRRTTRVIRISLYDGYPGLPTPDNFGRPRGLTNSACKESS
ncbi:hypothetical protein ACFY9N_05805 [Microbacterium sp. NPDC008134]|uniref:hypothetical protein n=1 Tax=Microbacterium sp. NPDC008134 TaxID=3364183 RepID=UPI0036EFDA70